ncbi:M3 family oligoendopeptidase [Psychromonas hadalis]|uniref:M3 family oligoendopeptidase n=1 Tax=Psychromonas hadalis TaxID=211669 RepID=UPI0003B789FA|nr:M3 family oligoendopeptidase [Psychromonas hadalis]
MSAPSWDLSIAYKNLDDTKINADINSIELTIKQLNSTSNDTIADLQNALILLQKSTVTLATISSYASCRSAVDAQNPDAKNLAVRMDKLGATLMQSFSPYQDKIINLESQQFVTLIEGNEETGSLSSFQFKLEQDRALKNQRLSVPEEQLLTAMNVDGRNAWGRLYNNLTGALDVTITLSDGRQETMGLATAASLLYGSDETRREPAWQAISALMKTHQQSIAAILNALAGSRLSEYEKRSHTQKVHFLDASLHNSRIEKSTLDALMQVAYQNRAVGQKAGLLMAKLFNSDTLNPWDELAAMPAIAGEEASHYSFDEAITIIRDAFAGIDEEMGEFVDMMVEKKLIDAAPQKNKRLGAFCSKFADTRTPLVFMTWGNSMSDLLTLAHELGHAFHNWVLKDLPIAQSHYPMTLAETASIFAENVVRDALMEKAKSDQDKRMMLWEEAQSSLALTINIPVRFDFEKAFYEQRSEGELTPEQLSELMDKTWSDWYGSSSAQSNEMFWASKLHFSIASVSFYNYPYLFGYLFSIGVYAQREAKGAHFYEDYKALLRDTGRMSAEQLVEKHLGLDIRHPQFWQQSLDRVDQQLEKFALLIS